VDPALGLAIIVIHYLHPLLLRSFASFMQPIAITSASLSLSRCDRAVAVALMLLTGN
jgi:hypothetical protein